MINGMISIANAIIYVVGGLLSSHVDNVCGDTVCQINLALLANFLMVQDE